MVSERWGENMIFEGIWMFALVRLGSVDTFIVVEGGSNVHFGSRRNIR